ncbi:hypothetical protein PACTADRAFT_49729 [Pachysolen tannophilus NRRL Y-2460]|uniref:Uncharacterized protein n=1 Tax=Pachysolen tannophilus NRRL Y-2460 TaxID=669874 RepID=A0A1E4TXB8_PACTA|nr:hypothetical protein PACTADRAFT_49729 [Pachysolen tannophilus NRRL Y-2460]
MGLRSCSYSSDEEGDSSIHGFTSRRNHKRVRISEDRSSTYSPPSYTSAARRFNNVENGGSSRFTSNYPTSFTRESNNNSFDDDMASDILTSLGSHREGNIGRDRRGNNSAIGNSGNNDGVAAPHTSSVILSPDQIEDQIQDDDEDSSIMDSEDNFNAHELYPVSSDPQLLPSTLRPPPPTAASVRREPYPLTRRNAIYRPHHARSSSALSLSLSLDQQNHQNQPQQIQNQPQQQAQEQQDRRRRRLGNNAVPLGALLNPADNTNTNESSNSINSNDSVEGTHLSTEDRRNRPVSRGDSTDDPNGDVSSNDNISVLSTADSTGNGNNNNNNNNNNTHRVRFVDNERYITSPTDLMRNDNVSSSNSAPMNTTGATNSNNTASTVLPPIHPDMFRIDNNNNRTNNSDNSSNAFNMDEINRNGTSGSRLNGLMRSGRSLSRGAGRRRIWRSSRFNSSTHPQDILNELLRDTIDSETILRRRQRDYNNTHGSNSNNNSSRSPMFPSLSNNSNYMMRPIRFHDPFTSPPYSDSAAGSNASSFHHHRNNNNNNTGDFNTARTMSGTNEESSTSLPSTDVQAGSVSANDGIGAFDEYLTLSMRRLANTFHNSVRNFQNLHRDESYNPERGFHYSHSNNSNAMLDEEDEDDFMTSRIDPRYFDRFSGLEELQPRNEADLLKLARERSILKYGRFMADGVVPSSFRHKARNDRNRDTTDERERKRQKRNF